MAQTTISISLDSDLKARLDALCAQKGTTVSAAFGKFASEAVQKQRFPLEEDTDDAFYAGANAEHLKKSIQQLNEGRVVTKTIEELDALVNE